MCEERLGGGGVKAGRAKLKAALTKKKNLLKSVFVSHRGIGAFFQPMALLMSRGA